MLKADNLPPSCAVVMKYGNLNFLACNGTTLPLRLSILIADYFSCEKELLTNIIFYIGYSWSLYTENLQLVGRSIILPRLSERVAYFI